MREDVKIWIEKATKDLKTAKVNLENNEYEAAAFFAHQSAEKALKSIYILKFNKLWKTHDLVGLLTEIKGDKNLLEICDELNDHYIKTRYPTGAEYTEEIAADAIEKSEEVVKWVKQEIKK